MIFFVLFCFVILILVIYSRDWYLGSLSVTVNSYFSSQTESLFPTVYVRSRRTTTFVVRLNRLLPCMCFIISQCRLTKIHKKSDTYTETVSKAKGILKKAWHLLGWIPHFWGGLGKLANYWSGNTTRFVTFIIQSSLKILRYQTIQATRRIIHNHIHILHYDTWTHHVWMKECC